MPTYDYECGKCGHKFEEFQSITSEPLKKCPVCKKMSLHRLIGCGAGVIFKGSGFYCTDYRSSDYKSREKSDSCCGSSSESSKASKPASETKTCKSECGSCCKEKK